jgi:hypothetical protein
MELLFQRNGYLESLLEERKRELLQEIEAIDPDRLLNAGEAALCAALVDSYSIDVPTILADQMAVHEQREVDVDVSRDPGRRIIERDRPFYVKGQALTVAVPFDGDPGLLHYQPNRFDFNPPRAEVVGTELRMTFAEVELDADAVRRQVEGAVGRVEWYLEAQREQVGRFNQTLKQHAEDAVRRRKQRLLQQRGVVAGLGIPIRPRAGAPATYALPVKRRQPAIDRVPTTAQPYAPEPVLAMEEYERILHIIGNMAAVMERSPSAFGRMQEEQLRDHFLVQLNGQYEGMAAGEVFNCEGRTDILIRADGRNVFIAECKFWNGPKALSAAIDQILAYTTWRDTKTAVILFNRRKDFSAVLGKIPEAVRQHPSFRRDVESEGETQFRFVLARPDDPSREIRLAVLVFDVPVGS